MSKSSLLLLQAEKASFPPLLQVWRDEFFLFCGRRDSTR